MTSPYLALYRKYRPQTFDDVAGQDQIVELLEASIKQKKISHAYLFCGGRGTGKTTVARIFAREIGCNEEDIIEIDAASNRGIDEIRELREAVRTAPFSSEYKVYIIDEAHMLTKEAANALLKTLEEPPHHVIFILATTDPEKLPATIVSRCQKLTFVSPKIDTLAGRLIHVAEGEGKSLEKAAADLIATHGKGSYRDALGVLEQVLTTGGKKITHEDVLVYLGLTNTETLIQLIKSMCTKDLASLATSVATLENSHHRALETYDDLIQLLREGLLIRVGEKKPEERLLDLPSLAKEYPYAISSKTILTLLSKRELLEVSTTTAWTAFLAILILVTEETSA